MFVFWSVLLASCLLWCPSSSPSLFWPFPRVSQSTAAVTPLSIRRIATLSETSPPMILVNSKRSRTRKLFRAHHLSVAPIPSSGKITTRQLCSTFLPRQRNLTPLKHDASRDVQTPSDTSSANSFRHLSIITGSPRHTSPGVIVQRTIRTSSNAADRARVQVLPRRPSCSQVTLRPTRTSTHGASTSSVLEQNHVTRINFDNTRYRNF